MSATVVPTKSNLMVLKKTQALARNGQELMDRKKNILVQEMLSMLPKVNQIRGKISDTYRKAYQALQEANITMGIVNEIAMAIPVDDGLHLNYRNLMGVDIPMVTHDPSNLRLSYGLRSTNSKFDYAYQMFQQVRDLTVQLAEIDNIVYRLANEIRKSQKRSNALKNVVLPSLDQNIKYITEILEEREREEFTRMKLIKKTKLGI